MTNVSNNLFLSRFCIVSSLDTNSYLLLHTYSGIVFFANSETVNLVRLVKKGVFYNEVPIKYIPVLKNLIKEKFIFFSQKSEEIEYKNVIKRITEVKNNKREFSIAINPTEDCNLSCSYCTSLTTRKKVLQKTIKKEDISLIFNTIKEIEKKKKSTFSKSICLFGGEPLLPQNKDLVEALLIECSKREILLDIITNGTFIDEYLPLLRKFKKHINYMQITVDGPAHIHDKRRIGPSMKKTFLKIINNIESIANLHFAINIRCNIDKKNVDYLPELFSYLNEKKWFYKKNILLDPSLIYCDSRKNTEHLFQNTTDYTNHLLKIREGNKDFKKFMTKEKAIDPSIKPFLVSLGFKKVESYFFNTEICGACGNNFITFASDGKLYACFAAVGVERVHVGSYNPKFTTNSNWDSWEKRNVVNIKKCRKCSLQMICGASCPQELLIKGNDIFSPPNSICERQFNDFHNAINLFKDEIMAVIKKKLKKKTS